MDNKYLETALKIRTEWGLQDMQRDRNAKFPENIEFHFDVPYGPYGMWNIMDIYEPQNAKESLPVIVSIHGGGWLYAHKEYYRYYCSSLAPYGFSVINFNYRLAPENPFPASLEDINELFIWLCSNGKNYNMDMNNIFIVADSAGAQMASQYATMLINPNYAKLFSFHLPKELHIRGIALNCGCYDLIKPDYIQPNKKETNDIYSHLSAYFGGEPSKYVKQMDTMSYLTSDFPPAYIMTSYYDFLKEESYPFYQKLTNLGVYCKYREYGNINTPELGHVFHCDTRLKEAEKCNKKECEFFLSLIQ